MRPRNVLPSRLPTALQFLLMCEGLSMDAIYQHFEDQLGGLLPTSELRAAVKRLVKDAVSAGTLELHGHQYTVSPTALSEGSHRQSALCDVAATRRRHRRRRQPPQEADNQGDAADDDDMATVNITNADIQPDEPSK